MKGINVDGFRVGAAVGLPLIERTVDYVLSDA
jgi:hypothetical protein